MLPLLLCGCSVKSESIYNQYLNYKFVLRRAGDIKGQDVNYPYNMDRLPGYVSYIDHFDTSNSYIDFQCKGNNFDNFRCETTFVLKTKTNGYIRNITVPFNTRFIGYELGTIEIFDDKINSYFTNNQNQINLYNFSFLIHEIRFQPDYRQVTIRKNI